MYAPELPLFEADAIVTLGGGLDAQGNLSPRYFARLDTAFELFHNGLAPRIITTGGWGLVNKRPESSESEQGKQYLVGKGVPEDAILTECTSRESIGNFVYAKQEVLVPNGLTSFILTTSASHQPRAEKIAGIVCGSSYTIQGQPAPEEVGIKEKAWEVVGALVLSYVTSGIEAGDDEAIERRLIERVPGYGSETTTAQLVAKSLANFLTHPSSVSRV